MGTELNRRAAIDRFGSQAAGRSSAAGWVLVVAQGVLCVAATGCANAPPLGQVRGRVTQDGKPLSGVMVSFLPDPLKGGDGPVASAITGADGRYALGRHDDEAGAAGAVVGWHRVVVKDVAQERDRNARQPAPSRVPERFRTAGHTPLSHQIQPGTQVIDLNIPVR